MRASQPCLSLPRLWPDAGAGGGFAEFGGVDPAMDPELAMALRVSMEEARAAARDPAADAAAGPGAAAATPAGAATAAAMDLSEEELLLQQVRRGPPLAPSQGCVYRPPFL